MLLPDGQSERPRQTDHLDMLQLHLNGEHRTMRFYRSEVEDGAVSRRSAPVASPDHGALSFE